MFKLNNLQFADLEEADNGRVYKKRIFLSVIKYLSFVIL